MDTTTRSEFSDLTKRTLEANQAHQYALTEYADRLAAEIQDIESLMAAVNTDDGEDELDAEIEIPGAKKATGPCPLTEFLNIDSPFLEEASRRMLHLSCITDQPMNGKEFEALADAVKDENRRLHACQLQKRQGENSVIGLENNVEGLDWSVIAEKVSAVSCTRRTADQCRIKWLGDRHPKINHGNWTPAELNDLKDIVSGQTEASGGKIDWVLVAKELKTGRTPVDCMRHGLPRQNHTWNQVSDQKLLDAVQLYGIDNWSIVARFVSEDATAAQCQKRYFRALNPLLKRGKWEEDEFSRLKLAVAAYGNSWVDVAACIPGRNNEQCRQRWSEHLSMSSAHIVWSEMDDKALIDAVDVMGHQWKAISIKINNGTTGTQCRLRYDKLKKSRTYQRQPSPAGPSNSTSHSLAGIDMGAPRDESCAGTSTSNREEAGLTPPGIRPRPRPVAKGKGKERDATLQVATENTPNVLSQEKTVPPKSPTLGPSNPRKRHSTGNPVIEGPAAKTKRTAVPNVRRMKGNHIQNAVPRRQSARVAARQSFTPQQKNQESNEG